MHPQYTRRSQLSVSDKFWEKVDTSGECWIWRGAQNQRGYGVFNVPPRRNILAHRYAYETFVGPIPPGLFVLHQCDTPACVRPQHLHLGTHGDNMREMRERGRLPLGDRSFSRLHPERLSRGDNHWTRRRRDLLVPHRYSKVRLTHEEIVEIRRRYAIGNVSQGALAAEFGVSRPAIGQVVRGETWKDVI